MQCAKCGADLQPGATVCPSCETRVVPTRKSVAAPRKRASAPAAPAASPAVPAVPAASAQRPTSAGRPAWQVPALLAVVAVVVAVSGWVVFSVFNTGANTPEGAALRVMQAYAVYDARGMLNNMTHASLTATDQATFEKQAADTKVANKGVDLLKDIAVTKVTVDPKNPNVATVQLTESILDAKTGKYALRNETLSLVKQDGKWLVKLF